MVEEELLHYLNQNIHLKQYKFIKIACGIIKSLRIRKSTGSYWLEEFISKYRHRLDSRISFLGHRKHKHDDYDDY